MWVRRDWILMIAGVLLCTLMCMTLWQLHGISESLSTISGELQKLQHESDSPTQESIGRKLLRFFLGASARISASRIASNGGP